MQKAKRVVASLLDKENVVLHEGELNDERLMGIICVVAETFLVVVFEVVAILSREEILLFLVRERQNNSAVLHDKIKGHN